MGERDPVVVGFSDCMVKRNNYRRRELEVQVWPDNPFSGCMDPLGVPVVVTIPRWQ